MILISLTAHTTMYNSIEIELCRSTDMAHRFQPKWGETIFLHKDMPVTAFTHIERECLLLLEPFDEDKRFYAYSQHGKGITYNDSIQPLLNANGCDRRSRRKTSKTKWYKRMKGYAPRNAFVIETRVRNFYNVYRQKLCAIVCDRLCTIVTGLFSVTPLTRLCYASATRLPGIETYMKTNASFKHAFDIVKRTRMADELTLFSIRNRKQVYCKLCECEYDFFGYDVDGYHLCVYDDNNDSFDSDDDEHYLVM